MKVLLNRTVFITCESFSHDINQNMLTIDIKCQKVVKNVNLFKNPRRHLFGDGTLTRKERSILTTF